MEALLNIVLVFPLIVCIVSIIHVRLGIVLFLICQCCIPYIGGYSIAGISVNQTLMIACLALGTIIFRAKKYPNCKFYGDNCSPFLMLYISLFILGICAELDFSIQLIFFRRDLFSLIVFPIIMVNIISWETKAIRYLYWGIIISFIISAAYALYLLFQPRGFNPYVSALALINGEEYSESYSAASDRAIGKIYSTFSHPLSWAYVICNIFLILFIFKFNKAWKKVISFIIVGICLFSTGVRTGVAAMFIPLLYIIFYSKKREYFYYSFGAIVVLLLAFSFNQELQDFFFSVFDTQGKTTGSNTNMRLSQWKGCLEATKNVLVGNGYGWCYYYMNTFGDHPKILAFESWLFVVYCNSGVLGIVSWMIFFVKIYKKNRQTSLTTLQSIYLDSFILLYIAFSMLTGDYHYLQWTVIYYFTLYMTFKIKNQKYVHETSCKKNN